MVGRINQSFTTAAEILADHKIKLGDFVFFGQLDTDFSKGVEYSRHPGFVEVILRTTLVPKQSDVESIIIKAGVEQFIDLNRANQFSDPFLLAFYRSGAGLYFANQHRKEALLPGLSTSERNRLLKQAKDIISGRRTYDPEEWFRTGPDLEYPIWSVGELVIKSILSDKKKSLFCITEPDLKKPALELFLAFYSISI